VRACTPLLDFRARRDDIPMADMICHICKQKEAKVHFTQIVDNEVKKVDLCEGCAKEKGPGDSTPFAIADMLLGLGASQQMEEAGATRGELRCPNCGFTQADFKKTARLGCSECYSVFAEGLGSLLKTMHKGTQHRGKTPQALRRAQDQAEQILRLEKDLQVAISREDFEQAAILRDQLKVARAPEPAS
jgi:protein arginine kinase activator